MRVHASRDSSSRKNSNNDANHYMSSPIRIDQKSPSRKSRCCDSMTMNEALTNLCSDFLTNGRERLHEFERGLCEWGYRVLPLAASLTFVTEWRKILSEDFWGQMLRMVLWNCGKTFFLITELQMLLGIDEDKWWLHLVYLPKFGNENERRRDVLTTGSGTYEAMTIQS